MPRIPILNNVNFDSGVFDDLVSNQITAAAAPSVGNQIATVISDAGTSRGIYGRFSVPDNYTGSPQLIIKGILDGAPGASDVLAFGFRKRNVADNAPADGTFDAANTGSITIGSSGLNYSDEDLVIMAINLTAGDYTANAQVFYWLYIDATPNTYTGNFLLTDLEFAYA
jgi:hypothetical protein